MERLATPVAKWNWPDEGRLDTRQDLRWCSPVKTHIGHTAEGLTATGCGLVLWQSGDPLVGGLVARCAPKQTVSTFPGVRGTPILRRRQHQGGQSGSAGQAECVIPWRRSLTVLQGRTSC